MAQSISQEAIGATGLPGATAASRYAGATASGAPTTGTFAVGDYVVDQSGAMWVCTVAGTPGTWQLSGVSVNENIAGKNFIINGGMDIWQRGTSFTSQGSSTSFASDRWEAVRYGYAAGLTSSQQTSGLTGFQYAIRLQRNSGTTDTTGMTLSQSLETSNSLPLAGQTVTFSFWARAGANYSATSNALNWQLAYSTTTNVSYIRTGFSGGGTYSTSVTLTTSWQRFTTTQTIPSNATQVAVAFVETPTGTAGANDYFDITGVQLEIAPQATPFSRAGGSIGGELALCQRYYAKTYSQGVTPNTLDQNGSLVNPNTSTVAVSAYAVSWRYPITMRTAPSITLWNPSILSSNSWYDQAGVAVAAATSNIGDGGVSIYNSATNTANRNAVIHAVASAEL